MTTEGLIRRVGLDEFPVQGRAGQGVQILKVSDATGPMAGAALLASDSTVDIYSVKSKRLRLEFKEVPSGKRAHPGVSLRKQVRDLFGGESLMRVVALEKLR